MTEISDLLARVRAATGEDWTLARDIHSALTGERREDATVNCTASLDAALALVEKRKGVDAIDILLAAIAAMIEAGIRPADYIKRLPLFVLAALLASMESTNDK